MMSMNGSPCVWICTFSYSRTHTSSPDRSSQLNSPNWLSAETRLRKSSVDETVKERHCLDLTVLPGTFPDWQSNLWRSEPRCVTLGLVSSSHMRNLRQPFLLFCGSPLLFTFFRARCRKKQLHTAPFLFIVHNRRCCYSPTSEHHGYVSPQSHRFPRGARKDV